MTALKSSLGKSLKNSNVTSTTTKKHRANEQPSSNSKPWRKGGNLISRISTLHYFKRQISTEDNETNKEQETMAKTRGGGGGKQSVEIVFKEAQI